jgi:hypothetical protein
MNMNAYHSTVKGVGEPLLNSYAGNGSLNSIPGWVKTLLLFPTTGAHLSSYPVGTGGSTPGVKRPGSETDHSSPSSTAIYSLHHLPHEFMAWCISTGGNS